MRKAGPTLYRKSCKDRVRVLRKVHSYNCRTSSLGNVGVSQGNVGQSEEQPQLARNHGCDGRLGNMAASSVEGPLSKWTNVMKGWQYRWFVLDDNAGLLSYYTSKENMARGARRGCVRLQGAVIGIDDEDDSTFTIRVDRKIFHFQARDAEERERWVRALEDTILRHTLQRQPNTRLWDQTSIVAPTQHNFDTKLTEADSYLQLLIEQIRVSTHGRFVRMRSKS